MSWVMDARVRGGALVVACVAVYGVGVSAPAPEEAAQVGGATEAAAAEAGRNVLPARPASRTPPNEQARPRGGGAQSPAASPGMAARLEDLTAPGPVEGEGAPGDRDRGEPKPRGDRRAASQHRARRPRVGLPRHPGVRGFVRDLRFRQRFDENRDGTIDEHEWKDAVTALDIDGDGELSISEVVVAGLAQQKAVASIVDADKDGLVSREERARLVALADRDGDGVLEPGEGRDYHMRVMISKNPWVLERFGRAQAGVLEPAQVEMAASAADRDGDGLLSPPEAHDYVHSLVPHGRAVGLEAPGGKGRRAAPAGGSLEPPDFLKTYDR